LIRICEADLVDEDMSGRALTADFDHDPERFAANQLATQSFSMISDVHDRAADRLAEIVSSTPDENEDAYGDQGVQDRTPLGKRRCHDRPRAKMNDIPNGVPQETSRHQSATNLGAGGDGDKGETSKDHGGRCLQGGQPQSAQ
jgi:hypothetical protein